MPDLKTTQQVFNLVFRDQDGGTLDTLTSEQAILGLVLDEASGRLKVQVAGGIGRSGHKLGSWSEEYDYNSGDIVNYGGQLYKCILAGSGDRPDTSTTYWAPYLDGAAGEKYVRATWYQAISSASGGAGAIGLPPDNASAEFIFNEWPDGIDAVVCGLDGDGRPDEATVYTTGRSAVYVPASGGLSGDGAYTLSGVPAALPCAFVYRYRCKLRDFNENYALRGCDFEQGLELENLMGTSGQINVTNNGDNTLTLSIPSPLLIERLHIAGSWAATLLSGDNVTIQKPDWFGGWARNLLQFIEHDDTIYMRFGAYGADNHFSFGYIGSSYIDSWIRFYPDSRVRFADNVIIGAYSVGSGAVRNFVMGQGSAPGSLTDAASQFVDNADGVAGKCTFHQVNEIGLIEIADGTYIKKDAGDPARFYEGMRCINQYDLTYKVYADGAWRTITSW